MNNPAFIHQAARPYAGFWKRFAALMIDLVVLIGVGAMIKLAGGEALISLSRPDAPVAGMVAALTFLLAVCWSYWSGFECSPLQATPGKLAVGIYVTDLHGDRLDFMSASARFYGKALSTLTLGIGYLMAGTTKKHQALHDLVSGCLVLSH